MKLSVLFVSLLITAAIDSKPLEESPEFEAANEIDGGETEKNTPIVRENAKNLKPTSNPDNIRNDNAETIEKSQVNNGGNNAIVNKQENIPTNLLMSLLQRLQFTPETFLQDRLSRLKNNLENLGFVLPRINSTTSKNLTGAKSGLMNLIGLNDSGSYSDRLEPAGLFGGNGWFANKGGILGGPGAILSTGSILTDYPTAYKK